MRGMILALTLMLAMLAFGNTAAAVVECDGWKERSTSNEGNNESV